MMTRPGPTECAPFYQNYINELPEGDIFEVLEVLTEQLQQVDVLLGSLDDKQARHRYAPGKWSIKEVVGHLIDAERMFAYRAMCFARNDPGPLPGMDENAYVQYANFDGRNFHDLLDEFRYVRLASISFFKSLDPESQMRRGMASGCEFTVRAFPFIIAGHAKHHFKILKERYL